MDKKQQETHMLQFQNQKLSTQLEVQRTDITRLEGKISSLKQKQASYEDNLGCVTRLWHQLNDDLQLLCVRSGADDSQPLAVRSGKANSTGHSEDPFLACLLKTVGETYPDGSDSENEDAEHAPRLDETLKKHCQSTKSLLVKVLQSIDAQRSRTEELAASLRSESGESALQTQNAKLSKEISQVRKTADSLHARHSIFTEKLDKAETQHLKDEARMEELTGEMDSVAMELKQTQRKLATAQQKEEGNAVPQMPRTNSAPVGATPAAQAVDTSAIQLQLVNLTAEKEHAEQMLAQREKQNEELEKGRLEALKELRLHKDQLNDESTVMGARPYQALAKQLSTLQSEAESYRSVIATLQREADLAYIRDQEKTLEAEKQALARCQLLEARTTQLEEQLRKVTAERDAAEVRHKKVTEAKNLKGEKTLDEMKIWCEKVQKANQLMKVELQSHRASTALLDEARSQKLESTNLFEAAAVECNGLRAQNAAMLEQVQSFDKQREELRVREAELEVFVEVLVSSADLRDSLSNAEAASGRKHAQMEIVRLQEQLSEHPLRQDKEAMAEGKKAAETEKERAEQEAQVLRSRLAATERSYGEAQEALRARKEDQGAYISEIEAISVLCEEMEQQNARLLQQLQERDEYASQIVQERLQADQSMQSVQEERELASQQAACAVTAANSERDRVLQLQEQVSQTMEQLRKAVEDAHKCNAIVEEQKRKLESSEQQAEMHRGAVEETQKCVSDLRHRAGEDLAELERERSCHASGTASQELLDEVKMYKELLKCQVCHDRRKEVVINKCFHLFCRQCIAKNLECRHRKCPACGLAFGQQDVHNVYL
ncbi:hypothetical protein CYMTET_4987 [Cymbomonas tetramitiformis]|uniref:E3 ubiquitin protein ligase n=1 Tax=Cymbomonas tetramitiformis TaxID=36881 RepID=A0AAE0H0C3_9CHLO|nr:hypothetical protein CYMTET_4987 [Cymbomonas tetramitiformis]